MYSKSGSASSTGELKIALCGGWGRGGVIPGWINIELQPDGDETRKHWDERKPQGKGRGGTSHRICIHVPTHTHAASHSHIPTYHNGILLLTDMLARAAFSYAL